MSEARMRIGDAERTEAAGVLGDHFAAGRLDADEHEERLETIWRARYAGDIAAMFADLPAPHPQASQQAPPAARTPSASWTGRDWNVAPPDYRARRRSPLGRLAMRGVGLLALLLVVMIVAGIAVSLLIGLAPVLIVGGVIFLCLKHRGGAVRHGRT